jgi:hypothetical protein
MSYTIQHGIYQSSIPDVEKIENIKVVEDGKKIYMSLDYWINGERKTLNDFHIKIKAQ